MILVDTSELKRPTQRKLHAAWCELHGRQVLAPPSVARELAPLAADTIWTGTKSAAETLLELDNANVPVERRAELRQQAWWAQVWRNTSSPYGIVQLTTEQQALASRLINKIDARCFPTTDPDDIGDHTDARIVCESMALGAKMLLTSNMRTIDHIEVNRWATENGSRLGFKAQPVLYQADATLTHWTSKPAEMEQWIQAAFLACWPHDDAASAKEVIQGTLKGISAMARGSGGKLTMTSERLINGLENHPDPISLVERTRERLPSQTIQTDRIHPSYTLHSRSQPATPPRPPDPASGYADGREENRPRHPTR